MHSNMPAWAYVAIPIGLIAVGLFSLVSAIKDWDWFMNHRKAKPMTRLLGRKNARIFYGLLGAVVSLWDFSWG